MNKPKRIGTLAIGYDDGDDDKEMLRRIEERRGELGHITRSSYLRVALACEWQARHGKGPADDHHP